jgi:hypothetical protein
MKQALPPMVFPKDKTGAKSHAKGDRNALSHEGLASSFPLAGRQIGLASMAAWQPIKK